MRVLTSKKIECLDEYFRLLQNRDYFEAHEVAEELWHLLRRSDDNLTSYFKGLINAAIALEHLKRNKPKSKKVALVAYNSFKKRCIDKEIDLDYDMDKIKTLIYSRWVSFGMEL